MAGENLITQVAPMGHVARVALQEQEAGIIKQQALQQATPDKLQKDNEQVAQTSDGAAGQKVKREKENRNRQQGQPDFDEKQQAAGGDPGAAVAVEVFQADPDGNVWAGNIVNMKV